MSEDKSVPLDTLALLGVKAEDLRERVIEGIVDRLLGERFMNEWGEEGEGPSSLMKALKTEVKQRIDKTIADLAKEHIFGKVETFIENLTLQETSTWGEKKGKGFTFIEYLCARAEAYLHEKVDFQGKDKVDAGGYNWSGTQTRLTWLVHHHLHYSISTAMKEAMTIANRSIGDALAETARLKLGELSKSLAVKTEIKS